MTDTSAKLAQFDGDCWQVESTGRKIHYGSCCE